MGLITSMRTQTAVYYAPNGYDSLGEQSFAAGVGIPCRWETDAVRFIDGQGENQVSQAIVYVDRDLEIGGLLWEGELADAPSFPIDDKDAYPIRQFQTLPKLRVTTKTSGNTLRTAIL
ncbi:MAG: hypothetical protein GY841_02730 [FCB group bacterium]|nr:hypothetical protein [FCB group bacterium]